MSESPFHDEADSSLHAKRVMTQSGLKPGQRRRSSLLYNYRLRPKQLSQQFAAKLANSKGATAAVKRGAAPTRRLTAIVPASHRLYFVEAQPKRAEGAASDLLEIESEGEKNNTTEHGASEVPSTSLQPIPEDYVVTAFSDSESDSLSAFSRTSVDARAAPSRVPGQAAVDEGRARLAFLYYAETDEAEEECRSPVDNGTENSAVTVAATQGDSSGKTFAPHSEAAASSACSSSSHNPNQADCQSAIGNDMTSSQTTSATHEEGDPYRGSAKARKKGARRREEIKLNALAKNPALDMVLPRKCCFRECMYSPIYVCTFSWWEDVAANLEGWGDAVHHCDVDGQPVDQAVEN